MYAASLSMDRQQVSEKGGGVTATHTGAHRPKLLKNIKDSSSLPHRVKAECFATQCQMWCVQV